MMRGDARKARTENTGLQDPALVDAARGRRLSEQRARIAELEAERDEARAALARVEEVLATPDDTQWWPVTPYMEPHDEDEVVETAVVAVDRVRAALTPTTKETPPWLTRP